MNSQDFTAIAAAHFLLAEQGYTNTILYDATFDVLTKHVKNGVSNDIVIDLIHDLGRFFWKENLTTSNEPVRLIEDRIAEYENMDDSDVPKWIVNSMGELGVKVDGRYFFLYKGESLEYEPLKDDVMMYRPVQKLEFGETCLSPWADSSVPDSERNFDFGTGWKPIDSN